MSRTTRLAARALPALAAVGAVTALLTPVADAKPVPTSGAMALQTTCNLSPDGVSMWNAYEGANEVGTVYYSSKRRGTYRITITDPRDADTNRAVMFVQFMQAGQGYWKDRIQFYAGDDMSWTFNQSFDKPYDIAKIAFGVAEVGQREIQIAWDRNSPCGA